MRKFKTCSRRSLPFRSLIFTGALMLLAAFAPCANADCPACIRFYDWEGRRRPSLTRVPICRRSSRATCRRSLCSSKMTMALRIPSRISQPKMRLSLEIQTCLLGPNRTSVTLGLHRSGQAHLNIVMTFPSVAGIYDIQSISFASRGSGNGFQFVQLQASLDGGSNWVNMSVVTAIPTAVTTIVLNNTMEW